jgi:FkbM family methyltransferase
MPFYSQHNQDKFLENYIFKGYKNGFFMDIGAHDGIDINNTLYFTQVNGWKGVNVEANKEVYNKLVVNRPESINLLCAVSNTDGTAEFIVNKGYTEMLSGLKNNYDPRHIERIRNENLQHNVITTSVITETKRIETICDEYNIKNINYLSIDVEGAEFDVIKSINFSKVFIDVIGFENNYEDISAHIIKYLETKDFVFVNKTIDIFMIHKKSKFIKNLL